MGGIVFDVEVTGPLSAVPTDDRLDVTDDATDDVTDDVATDDATDPADDVAAVFEEPVLEEPTIDEADEADGPDQVAGAEVDEIAVDETGRRVRRPAETVADRGPDRARRSRPTRRPIRWPSPRSSSSSTPLRHPPPDDDDRVPVLG